MGSTTLAASISSVPFTSATSWFEPVMVFPKPPSGFNPLTASPQALTHYGFPQRPAANSPRLQSWTAAMSKAKYWVAPNPVPGTYDISAPEPPHPSLKINRTREVIPAFTTSNVIIKPFALTGSEDGPWAGYSAIGSNNGNAAYYDTSAEWNVSSVPGDSSYPNSDWNSNETPAVSAWTGMGGTSNAPSDVIIQAGTEDFATATPEYRFWTEYYPNKPIYEGPVINAYDAVYVDVEYLGNGQTYYYLENTTTGAYDSFTNATPDYNGSSAEYEVEQNGSFLPDFGDINFTDCQNMWNTGSGLLNTENYWQDVLINGSGYVMAEPVGNSVNSSGGFSVERVY